jgi:hypothetical protein
MATGQSALVLLGASGILRINGFVQSAEERGLALLGLEEEGVPFVDPRQLPERVASWEMREASPADEAGILAILAEWESRYRIRGICSLREQFVRAAALAADYLGLPSIGLRAAQVCRDKLLQRLYLRAWSPRYQVISPADGSTPDAGRLSADIAFPAVLKPTGRYGSSGVRRVRDPAELRSWLGHYEPGETVLLEEAVAGPEYSVEALVQHGKPFFESITAKRTNEDSGQFFVEMGHSVPAVGLTKRERQALLTANREILAALDVRDGIVHAEYRLASGRVVLMEVNARLPGDSIPGLYRLATGASLETALTQIAVGEPASYPAPRRHARQVFLEHPPGILKDVHIDITLATRAWWLSDSSVPPGPTAAYESESPAALRLVTVFKQRGESLSEMTNSRDRAVTFVIDAASPSDLDLFEQEVRKGIHVEVTPY